MRYHRGGTTCGLGHIAYGEPGTTFCDYYLRRNGGYFAAASAFLLSWGARGDEDCEWHLFVVAWLASLALPLAHCDGLDDPHADDDALPLLDADAHALALALPH